MAWRAYTSKELKAGEKTSNALAEAIQDHHSACGCALCNAWMALRPVDVMGNQPGNTPVLEAD